MHLVAHNGSAVLGGGEIWTALLLQGLRARGQRVLLLCRDRAVRERPGACGIPVGVAYVGGEAMLRHALLLARVLRRHRPDALLLTTFEKVVLAGARR